MATMVSQLQPPVKGLNYRTPAIKLDPQEALLLDNVLPQPQSGELRSGYEDHVINIPGSVNTLAPFVGNLFQDNRVFAFNDQGDVFDATLSTDAPVAIEHTDQGDGNWDYTNSQGVDQNYLILVSPNGGYWTYSTAGGFVQRDITGDGAGKRFEAVFNWKDRVWLIEENSTKAYYLDIGAVQGPAHLFDFGPVMNQGGFLSYGQNWTFNAGYDIDDYLVLVTTSGEVLVYKGVDPTQADSFLLQGVWYVGRTPKGNKSFTTFGGEVFIMSALGVVPVSKLVNGGVANDYQVSSAQIQPELTKVFQLYKDNFGWELETFYNRNFLMIKTPIKADGTYSYWIMNVQTGAWGTISQMPMNCSSQVVDDIYFGTTDGRVCKAFTGNTDGQQIDGTPGRPIIGTYMGGFNDYSIPTNLKTWQLARPIFRSTDKPAVAASILIQYESGLPTINGSETKNTSGGRFDISKWNECVWAGGADTYSAWCGLQGLGYYGAYSIVFTGEAGTQYISSNITLLQGGIM